jgi:GNAT superfamily N-acetyltransferase
MGLNPDTPTRHPQHDEVATAVRRWYIGSTPDAGLFMDSTWYGYAIRPGSAFGSRVILTLDEDGSVPAALEEVCTRFGQGDIDMWVEGRERAERLHQALSDAGCHGPNDTIFLAHVGPVRVDRPAPTLAITTVRDEDDDQLTTWARVKLQGFADSNTPPYDAAVAREVEVWRAQSPISRYELANCDGEPVAILGAHEVEQDRLVFNLATLPSHRHQGIAQALLARWIERGRTDGARSLLINGDDGGQPVMLYRRMGFTDEVYWRRTYTWPASTPPHA